MSKPKVSREIILDANNPKIYRTHIDILNECFGVKLRGHQMACYPFKGFIPGTECYIWFPKLFRNSSTWKNSIVNDGNTILEVGEPGVTNEWVRSDEDPIIGSKHPIIGYRLVFAKLSRKDGYCFVGAFKNDKNKLRLLNHSYERVAVRVKLIGRPVGRIEFLD